MKIINKILYFVKRYWPTALIFAGLVVLYVFLADNKLVNNYLFPPSNLIVKSFEENKHMMLDNMFASCTSLTSLDLSNFDTSNVTDMLGMFYRCETLTSLDLSNFDTSNVTDMDGMFRFCEALTIDCSSWNVEKVTTHTYFSQNAKAATEPNWVS